MHYSLFDVKTIHISLNLYFCSCRMEIICCGFKWLRFLFSSFVSQLHSVLFSPEQFVKWNKISSKIVVAVLCPSNFIDKRRIAWAIYCEALTKVLVSRSHKSQCPFNSNHEIIFLPVIFEFLYPCQFPIFLRIFYA